MGLLPFLLPLACKLYRGEAWLVPTETLGPRATGNMELHVERMHE